MFYRLQNSCCHFVLALYFNWFYLEMLYYSFVVRARIISLRGSLWVSIEAFVKFSKNITVGKLFQKNILENKKIKKLKKHIYITLHIKAKSIKFNFIYIYSNLIYFITIPLKVLINLLYPVSMDHGKCLLRYTRYTCICIYLILVNWVS